MKNIILLIVLFFLALFRATGQEIKGNGLFEGLSKPITEDQTIHSYGIEVTFDKTSNIIFPSGIVDADLGSSNLVGGKFPNIDNILRIKAAIRGFNTETNFSVITKDGTFYSFNVRYADEPKKININVEDLVYSVDKDNPQNSFPVYRKELGKTSPHLVQQLMKTIHKQDKRQIKHIGAKGFGIQCLLKGIYTHEELLYFYVDIKNTSNLRYDIDFIRFKLVDKQVMKRVAIQEIPISPVEAYNQIVSIEGGKSERTVFAFQRFTIPDTKVLQVEIFEKNGGRNYSFMIDNTDLVLARGVESFKNLEP